MHQQPKKRLLPRFAFFLSSPRGQVFATCCAYSSLGCIAICILLIDYSRLAWPFLIPLLFLAGLGLASRSHYRIALVTGVLWVIPANALLVTLFDVGNQANQQARLQQQIVQLENQHNSLQDQQTVLQKQQSFLLVQFKQTKNQDLSNQVSTDLSTTKGDLLSLTASLQYTTSLVDYNIRLMRVNDRNLPNSSLIDTNLTTMKDNDAQIQYNQQDTINQQILSNNNDLPMPEKVPLLARPYQNNCVSGYLCLVQPSWQQPFINGWQHLTAEPLSTTWLFWLLLLLALSGMFLLLPFSLNPRRIISYRKAYSGPLSRLTDPNFPQQKRQQLEAETSLVKIEVRSSIVPSKQENQGDEAQDFLYLNLGPGTTIADVFLKQNAQQTEEVSYDRATGNVTLKLKPTTPPVVHQEKGTRTLKRKAVRRFPMYLYVVVDYFAGSIDAVTPLARVERLQEQQGPHWIGEIAHWCHELVWWVYAIGCTTILLYCSYAFFRASTPLLYSAFSPFGLYLLIAGIVLKAVELVIVKTAIRRQRIAAPATPALLAS